MYNANALYMHKKQITISVVIIRVTVLCDRIIDLL